MTLQGSNNKSPVSSPGLTRGSWERGGGEGASSAAALAGLDVEVAARHWRTPIGDQVARAFEIGRPFLRDHGARRLPDRIELAVALDLADVDGLGDVVVRHH